MHGRSNPSSGQPRCGGDLRSCGSWDSGWSLGTKPGHRETRSIRGLRGIDRGCAGSTRSGRATENGARKRHFLLLVMRVHQCMNSQIRTSTKAGTPSSHATMYGMVFLLCICSGLDSTIETRTCRRCRSRPASLCRTGLTLRPRLDQRAAFLSIQLANVVRYLLRKPRVDSFAIPPCASNSLSTPLI